MSDKRNNRRIIEIATGFFFLLTIIAILLAYMMNFDYNLPHITIEDNFDYLTDSLSRQKLSSVCWLLAGSFSLFLLPLYLALFFRFQKGMHILNGFLILTMAWAFVRIGILQIEISKISLEGIENINLNQSAKTLEIMLNMKAINILLKMGFTAYGSFATILSISHFRKSKFPTIGSLLAFLSGPLLISFLWINSMHILFTTGVAGTSIGLIIIGAWLVNRGLFKSI